MDCPICDGYGKIGEADCPHCDDGVFWLSQCGRTYVDNALSRAINMVSYADKGILPVGGGMLDQSAWFVDLWSTVTAEQNEIDRERERR